ncbi:MAG: helix-turn-helix domain-containing protein [Leucobacter sp.]|nr:helix-turn-helix domain-containing protein [Leucobacter sp.]
MRTDTLGGFLKNRRDRISPDAAGVPAYGTVRRVPGLRREELAMLAGVSVGYYTRLEQDQTGTASAQVLDALARALRLDETEATHLYNLAHRSGLSCLEEPDPEMLAPRASALLAALGESVPAIVLGRRGDILAWNRSGHAIAAGHLPEHSPQHPATRPSTARMFFLDTNLREQYRNWEELARIHIGYLRLTSGRYPNDATLAALIGELSMHSHEFARLWAAGEVADCTTGQMLLNHPLLGKVDLDYQVWLQPDSPDHRLEVYTPRNEATRAALARMTGSTETTSFDDRP